LQFQTKSFGTLEYDEKSIIRIQEGMLGFARLKNYVLVENPDTDPFKILHSLDDPYVAFPMVDPRLLDPHYQCTISAEDMESLGLEHPSDVVMLAVTVIPEDPTQSTVNLKAPLLINQCKMLGKQVVLTESCYGTMQPLMTPPDLN
jgi:flagellar assembly factor FliW